MHALLYNEIEFMHMQLKNVKISSNNYSYIYWKYADIEQVIGIFFSIIRTLNCMQAHFHYLAMKQCHILEQYTEEEGDLSKQHTFSKF